ncbi:MAG: hypothetical protein GY935_02155 [Gammaproteobacteria bacterium]|nr:hypothetical protein [Gammaproteobacteria bacterium]
MALDNEALQIVAKLADLAGRYGLKEQVESMTNALREAAPDDENVRLVHAIACLRTEDFDKAAAILKDELLAANPKNDLAKAFLSMVYHFQQKEAERDRISKEILDAGDDADEGALALIKGLAEA